jgi:hypothetical protein
VARRTTAKADQLDGIGVPVEAGRPEAVKALRAAGLSTGRMDVLAAAIRLRRDRAAAEAAS